jgi:hypothetical protein
MGGNMPKAIDLLRLGKRDEIWQMCCGYLNLNIQEFMNIQKRLLLEQIGMLSHSQVGHKIFNGNWPQTVDDFRRETPLTTYAAYCPELSEKQEVNLPSRPAEWVHTSGRTGEYACKWVPISSTFIEELSKILYGLGLISAARKWGDQAPFIERPNMIYTVAPRPYISGALASFIQEQTPSRFFPSLEKAENLDFEARVKLAFEEALSGGLDYFFGLSLILSAVGTKFSQSAGKMNISPYLKQPKAIMRLTKGMIKSRLAGRPLLPKDLWKVRGIICSGLDSAVYKEKIKQYWGRYPLDIYANTEGGVIATQTWDYQGMTFIPSLNFLEFIPEKEHLKWRADSSYKPKILLLDEVQEGQCYEIVITNFHGGSLVRYRIGDMIRITALSDAETGIKLPQMVFERRCDDMLDFASFRLTEKSIWQALENTGVAYEDWVAYKTPGELILNVLVELKSDQTLSNQQFSDLLYAKIAQRQDGTYAMNKEQTYLANSIDFTLKVEYLPKGAFAHYMAHKRAEGSDIAHLKPPHINPSPKVLSVLTSSKKPAVISGSSFPIKEVSSARK